MSFLQNGTLAVYERGETEAELKKIEECEGGNQGRVGGRRRARGGDFIDCIQCLSGRLLHWLAGSQLQHSIHFVLSGRR